MIKDLWAKISYYWFIGMLALVGLLCGGLEVDASTITPSSTLYMSLWCEGYSCPYTEGGSTYHTSWLNKDTGYVVEEGYDYRLTHIKFKTTLNSSNYLQTGQQYVVQIRWNINPRYNFTQYYPNEWTYVLNLTHTDNTYTNDENFSASCVKYSSDNYGVVCSFTIQPSKPVKDFTFRILFPFQERSSYFGMITSVNYKAIKIVGNTDSTDAINQQTIILDNSINNINDNITDDNVDDPNDMFEEMEDLIPTNGVISSLITLPITLYQKILNSINGTCQTFSLGSLYGTNLIMPCIDIDDYLGSTLWNTIDLIISGVFVLTIARKMIKIFNSFTSLKEGDVIND